jgi:hypothetical protein
MSQTYHKLIAVCLLSALTPGVLADEMETLKPLVEKAIKVAGIDKIQSVRAWTLLVKVTDRHEALRSGTRRDFVQLPDQYRSDFESEVYEGDPPIRIRTSVVINGRSGWRTVTGKTEEMSAEDVDREKAWGIRLQPGWSRDVALLLDQKYQPTPLGERDIGGRVAAGIKLTREGNPPIHLFFDKDTCRLLKMDRVLKDGQRSETVYGDYREVGGIQVPHKWAFKTDGNVDHEIDVDGVGKVRIKGTQRPDDWVYEVIELKFADKLDAKLFEKP